MSTVFAHMDIERSKTDHYRMQHAWVHHSYVVLRAEVIVAIQDLSINLRIAGNVCSDSILRFVVEIEVCGCNVRGLLDKSFCTDNMYVYPIHYDSNRHFVMVYAQCICCI